MLKSLACRYFSRFNIIRFADQKVMPWKNGGGTTREIARFPPNQEYYLFRVSNAEVKSNGPFSVFPRYDRILMLLSLADNT